MMLLLDWYRQWVEIKRENNRENDLIETLKHEIEMLRLERDRLLNHALRTNEQEVQPKEVTEFQPIPPRNIPWAVRRQMLEREDRQAALLKKNKNTEIKSVEITVDDLEKELNIVESEREG